MQSVDAVIVPLLLAVGAGTVIYLLAMSWSRVVSIGLICGLPAVTFVAMAGELTRPHYGWSSLLIILWWPVLVLINVVIPWVVLSAPALLFHRRGHRRTSRVTMGVAVLLYVAWLYRLVLYPVYDLTGTCLPPAFHYKETGGDGTVEGCDLPPG